MRRFVTLSLSMSLLLGLSAAGRLTAQDEKKAEPAEAAEKEAPEATAATSPAAEKPIPPEVQEKLDAARRAVAEAIVAAQDAGLVDTSIDPPPILDILITGRATDLTALKNASEENPEVGVSPEVFGAWFTGFATEVEGVTAEKNVRIIPPSKGLRDWYEQRDAMLREQIAAVRGTPAEEEAAEEKTEEPEAAPAEEPDAEEATPAPEPAAPVEEEPAAPVEEPAAPVEEEPAAPVEEEPAAPVEEPAAEEPAAEPAEEPAAEEPAAEPAEEPATEEPAAEEPADNGDSR